MAECLLSELGSSIDVITFPCLFFLVKVQGKDRSYIKFVAEQLGLDGTYVSRTYIEQIQLEKLVNDVMVLLFI